MTHTHRPITRRRIRGNARLTPSWGAHDPVRPAWACSSCRAPWPCTIAQQRLLAAYRFQRRALGILLALLRDQAVLDLPAVDPQQLGVRFTSWFRRAPHPAGPAFRVTSATTHHHDDRELVVRRVRRRVDPWAAVQLDILFAMIIPEGPRDDQDSRDSSTPDGSAPDCSAEPSSGSRGGAL
ncbi:hypothetical protein ACQP2F_33215 [Actinoplanes sp. CA-030573]|uniref:hypothetical protein n=1 Tax=Actinoplanes sp. CA-030573 TaxID=3239898 RepID=UPI003D925B77